MSFVSSSDTITIKAYLTQKGKQLYFNGDDKDIIVKYVTFGDDDANYFISSSIKLDDTPNRLSTGFVPDLSGDDERCIYNLANGVDIKNKIRISSYKKGDIVNQFCQPPYTLIQEVSNGDGTTYFNKIENSIDCGFRYKSNIFSRSFIKQTCTGSSIGQSYTVTTTYGQFTGLTQSDADNKALNYLNVSGQTIANNLGSCLFASTPQERTFEKNDCPNGGRPYVVTTNSGQFTSLISENDANNKALIWLDSNGQNIANQNGECKVLNSTEILLTEYTENNDLIRKQKGKLVSIDLINKTFNFEQIPSHFGYGFNLNNPLFNNKKLKIVFEEVSYNNRYINYNRRASYSGIIVNSQDVVNNLNVITTSIINNQSRVLKYFRVDYPIFNTTIDFSLFNVKIYEIIETYN